VAPPHELLWHEPMREAERILMVDFASIDACTKGVAHSTSHEGAGPRLQLPNLRTPHLHLPMMGWTGCTVS
jgi:hypothetical protein